MVLKGMTPAQEKEFPPDRVLALGPKTPRAAHTLQRCKAVAGKKVRDAVGRIRARNARGEWSPYRAPELRQALKRGFLVALASRKKEMTPAQEEEFPPEQLVALGPNIAKADHVRDRCSHLGLHGRLTVRDLMKVPVKNAKGEPGFYRASDLRQDVKNGFLVMLNPKNYRMPAQEEFPPDQVLALGPNASRVAHNRNRCKAIAGKKVRNVLGTIKVKEANGKKRTYRKSDLRWDVKRGFLKMKTQTSDQVIALGFRTPWAPRMYKRCKFAVGKKVRDIYATMANPRGKKWYHRWACDLRWDLKRGFIVLKH